MTSHLQRQVEKIIDTGQGQSRDVIIRMGGPEVNARGFMPLASEAIRRRLLVSSARDLLPVDADLLARSASKKVSADTRRKLAARGSSLTAQTALSVAAVIGRVALQAAGLQALAPLLESDIMGKVLAETSAKRRKGPVTQKLWSARSVVMTRIKLDDLAKLPSEVPGIQDIYPNRRLSLPNYARVQSLPQTIRDNKASAWGVHAIGALATWGAYGARGEGMKIAVLDTGVDAEHPDLVGKIDDWVEFDAGGDKVAGSTAHDTDEHGTHVAGTLVGGKVSGQWIGVAPAAKLAVAMVLDGEKGGTDAQVLAGIDWALERGVHVINMSLGGLTLFPDVPNTYTTAIIEALQLGVPVVAAIGNEGGQTTGSPGNDLFAYAVGATDHQDRAAGFSGGRTQIIRESNVLPPESLPLPYLKPDVSAPGVAIHSAIPNGKWAAFSGTSMATPHASGAIALLLSATSIADIDGPQRAFLIQDLLTGSVEELGETGQDQRFGFGRIDVLRAIGAAIERGFVP